MDDGGASSLPHLAAENGEYLTISGSKLLVDWLCTRITRKEAMCFAQLECVQKTLHWGLTVRLSEECYVICRSCSLSMDSKARFDPMTWGMYPSSGLRLRTHAQSCPTAQS